MRANARPVHSPAEDSNEKIAASIAAHYCVDHHRLCANTKAFRLASERGPYLRPTLAEWSAGAFNCERTGAGHHDQQRPSGRRRAVVRLGNVSSPTISLYPVHSDSASASGGPAVVVFPGGAYRILAIDLEGTEVCDWLNSIRVNCVLLKYRVPDTGPFPKSEAALQDAQRAVGMVREHAAEWHIDPKRVGVLGFSARGHLAAALSTHYDRRLYPAVDAADQQSCRPDFTIIIYPGYLAFSEKNFQFNPDIPATSSTPPSFIVQAEDDPVHVENAVEYFMELKKAGVSAELHTYAEGGHGYGLRPTALPVTHWPQLAAIWLHTIGVLPGSAE